MGVCAFCWNGEESGGSQFRHRFLIFQQEKGPLGGGGGWGQNISDTKDLVAPEVGLTLRSAHRGWGSDGHALPDLLLLTPSPLGDNCCWRLVTPHHFQLLREVLPLRELIKSI